MVSRAEQISLVKSSAKSALETTIFGHLKIKSNRTPGPCSRRAVTLGHVQKDVCALKHPGSITPTACNYGTTVSVKSLPSPPS